MASPQPPAHQRHTGRNRLIARPDDGDRVGHRQVDGVSDITHSRSQEDRTASDSGQTHRDEGGGVRVTGNPSRP